MAPSPSRGCHHAPMRRPLLLLLAALLVLPATASAKLTRLPGTGETPTVEVDAAGTALVAWYLQQLQRRGDRAVPHPARHARVPGAADPRRHPGRHLRRAAAGDPHRRPERCAGGRAPVRRVDAVGRRRGDVRPDGADQRRHLLHRRDRGGRRRRARLRPEVHDVEGRRVARDAHRRPQSRLRVVRVGRVRRPAPGLRVRRARPDDGREPLDGKRGHLRPLDLDAPARARDGLLRPRRRPARAVARP